ncbi:MAG: UPF0164 family protein [Acidobacteriota bacterium]|nr:UPF0164 family protein [Acidobacteriota bacterium]
MSTTHQHGWALPLLLAASTASAQSISSPFAIIAEQSRTAISIQGTGARAVGLGGAFIALADDASAVSFNPAGLAQLLSPEFSLVAESLQRDQTFSRFKSTDQDFDDSSLKDTAFHPLFFSATIPFRRTGRNVAVTFSYQRLVDFDFDSDRNLAFRSPVPGSTPRRLTNSVTQKGSLDVYSIAIGAELTPRVLAGASLNLWRGQWSFDSRQEIEDSGSVYDIIQDNKFRGVNLNAGLLWRSKYLNMGLTYRSGFRSEYTFDGRYTALDDQGRPVVQPAQEGLLDLNWPETIGFGLAYKPSDRLTFTYDSVKTRWSGATFRGSFTTRDPQNGDFQDLSLDGANFFDFLKSSRTTDTTDRRGGVEWIAFLGDSVIIPVRVGLFREPQPTVDRVTGEQRVLTGYTLGFGLKYHSITVDLAFKDAKSENDISKVVLIGGATPILTKGQESLRERRIYLTAIFQLNSEGAQRAVKKFFVGN